MSEILKRDKVIGIFFWAKKYMNTFFAPGKNNPTQ